MKNNAASNITVSLESSLIFKPSDLPLVHRNLLLAPQLIARLLTGDPVHAYGWDSIQQVLADYKNQDPTMINAVNRNLVGTNNFPIAFANQSTGQEISYTISRVNVIDTIGWGSKNAEITWTGPQIVTGNQQDLISDINVLAGRPDPLVGPTYMNRSNFISDIRSFLSGQASYEDSSLFVSNIQESIDRTSLCMATSFSIVQNDNIPNSAIWTPLISLKQFDVTADYSHPVYPISDFWIRRQFILDLQLIGLNYTEVPTVLVNVRRRRGEYVNDAPFFTRTSNDAVAGYVSTAGGTRVIQGFDVTSLLQQGVVELYDEQMPGPDETGWSGLSSDTIGELRYFQRMLIARNSRALL